MTRRQPDSPLTSSARSAVPTSPAAESAGERREKPRWRETAESLAVAILVALVVRSSVVEAFWVPSGSMLPTIQIGDHLFVNKLSYSAYVPFTREIGYPVELFHWRGLQRDEIVVFVSPENRQLDLIKRVIAVGGDTVEVRDKKLYINAEAIPDPHAFFADGGRGVSQHVAGRRDNFGPVRVPPGKFFVMGDNRDQSYDSRFWGFADEKDVKGRATFIYWSWDDQRHWPRFSRLGRFIR